MRRWILLALLAIAGAWGDWIMFQRHREEMWCEAFTQASGAFARHDYAGTEKILVSILPDTEKRYAHDHSLSNVPGMPRTPYRPDRNYEQPEPTLNKALQREEARSQTPAGEQDKVHLDLPHN